MVMSLPTLYFGYGSNLWLHQMRLRCPCSIYIGVGRLTGYRWIINARGYANVVPSDQANHEVYGLVYELSPADEAALDENEGVPYAYTKEVMDVEFWKSSNKASSDRWEKVDVTTPGQQRNTLVYIDRQRKVESKPKDEYVHRMNMGITDALSLGIPAGYVKESMRPFISSSASKEGEILANEQAKRFTDEP